VVVEGIVEPQKVEAGAAERREVSGESGEVSSESREDMVEAGAGESRRPHRADRLVEGTVQYVGVVSVGGERLMEDEEGTREREKKDREEKDRGKEGGPPRDRASLLCPHPSTSTGLYMNPARTIAGPLLL
jgi:hypothetical protein